MSAKPSSSSTPPVAAAAAVKKQSVWTSLIQWIDADYFPGGPDAAHDQPDRVDWLRCLPFVILHLGCLGAIWTGWSWTAVLVAIALYVLRMFAVTGIYHRYFSHKTYHTSRVGQFLLALWGGTTVQRGPLWWAYHHRHHHKHSDDPEDVHSPHVHGFWWSHIGWITSKRNFPTDYRTVPDLAKFPELVFLNRFDAIVPTLFALAIFGAGWALEVFAPQLGVTRWQLLVWGFFISTTALFHGTSCINSMAHLMGRRRFKTDDDSRNSFILAIITLGEGWHNNHHRYQSTTKQGFYWWEIDPTYYGLKFLSWTRFIWGLKGVPKSIYEEAARNEHSASVEAAQVRHAKHGPLHDFATLKRVVPTAAAIAIATVPTSTVNPARRPESALHKDVTSLDATPPASDATKSASPGEPEIKA